MQKLFLLSGLILFFSVCSEIDASLPANEGIVESKALFDKYLSTRTGNTERIFEIKEVERNGDLLNIAVYGECVDTYYKIVWDGSVMYSNPPAINLLIAFEIPQGIVCDMNRKEHRLKVNLKELLRDNYKAGEYTIHVINGSKVQDKTSSPDGNVTDKNN